MTMLFESAFMSRLSLKATHPRAPSPKTARNYHNDFANAIMYLCASGHFHASILLGCEVTSSLIFHRQLENLVERIRRTPAHELVDFVDAGHTPPHVDRKSTRLNSSHV